MFFSIRKTKLETSEKYFWNKNILIVLFIWQKKSELEPLAQV